MSTEKYPTAISDTPMSETPSVLGGSGVGIGVIAPKRSAREVMGWSEEQEQFFVAGLQNTINNSVKAAFAEAFKAGTLGGQPVTPTPSETSGDSALYASMSEHNVSEKSASPEVSPQVVVSASGFTEKEKEKSLNKFLSRVKLGQPDKWGGNVGKGKDPDVRQFLRSLSYFELKSLPPELWGSFATSFLKDKNLDL